MMLKLALVACLGLGAYAQTPAAPAQAAPPQAAPPEIPPDVMTNAVYSSLLRRMEMNETQADRIEKAGKDPLQKTRKWVQLKTGLTDKEYALVRPILLHAISSTNAKRAEAKAAIDQAQKDNGGEPIITQQSIGTKPLPPHKWGVPLTAAQKQAIGALFMQEEQLLRDHVQQIEAVLGGRRFQEFDSAVRKLAGDGASLQIIPVPVPVR